jgi:hypothetical protein
MAQYRIYHLGRDGRVSAPPDIVECADDQAATQKAQQAVDGHDVELWEDRRFIVRLPANDS